MRIVALILLLSTLLLTACTQVRRSDEVLSAFCREYPIDRQIYSSLASEREEGYIDAEMLRALYGISEYPVRDFSLVFYGKVDTVREIGAFIIENGQDEILLTELISRRIGFLSSFAEGEGFVKKYRGVIVYGFVENSARAQELFDRII